MRLKRRKPENPRLKRVSTRACLAGLAQVVEAWQDEAQIFDALVDIVLQHHNGFFLADTVIIQVRPTPMVSFPAGQ
ncbi:MAG: hypothetical protein AB1847_04610 [bacterium]